MKYYKKLIGERIYLSPMCIRHLMREQLNVIKKLDLKNMGEEEKVIS